MAIANMNNSKLIAALLPTALLFSCATQGESPDDGANTDGKSDGAATALAEASEDQRASLLAWYADCLHIFSTENPTYDAQVRLICMPQGGVAQPVKTYVGVLSPGEIGAIDKLYEVPEYMSDVPTNIQFAMNGDRATLAYDIEAAVERDGDLAYETKRLTVQLNFAGSSDEPAIAAQYSLSRTE